MVSIKVNGEVPTLASNDIISTRQKLINKEKLSRNVSVVLKDVLRMWPLKWGGESNEINC